MKNKYSDSVFSRNTPESDYYLKSSWVFSPESPSPSRVG